MNNLHALEPLSGISGTGYCAGDNTGYRDPCNVVFDKSTVIIGDSTIMQSFRERTSGVLRFDVVKPDGFRRG